MTSTEKQKIANFLDLTNDFTGSGYKSQKREYNFSDDLTSLNNTAEDKNTEINTIDSLEKINEEIRICNRCPLFNSRTNAAPGEGSEEPLVMIIGEGPGEDEDKQGRPFTGKAGQLLDKMLSSINLSRTTNTFITNIVKCRPLNNRDPLPDETAICAHFLERQILLIKPKIILVLGKVAAHALLKTIEPIGNMRGKFTELSVKGKTFPLLVTYHPAALLRNEDFKRPAWEDLKLLKSKLPMGD